MKNKYRFSIMSLFIALLSSCAAYAQLFDPTHIYKIVNPASGRIIEMGGGGNLISEGTSDVENSVKADLWEYWGGANQQWKFTAVQTAQGQTAYTITNRNSQKVLMIPDIYGPASNLAGGNRCDGSVKHRFATQQSYSNDTAKMWYIQPQSNGQYSIVLVAYNSPLAGSADAENNPKNTKCNRVSVYLDRDGVGVQPWTIVDVSVNPNNIYTSSVFYLVNNRSNKALTVEPNSDSDRTVKQMPTWGLAAEQWTFTPTSGGYYRINNRRNGLILEIGGGSTANGATVNLWENGGGLLRGEERIELYGLHATLMRQMRQRTYSAQRHESRTRKIPV